VARFLSEEQQATPRHLQLFCNMWLWALLPVSLAVFGTVGLWTVFAVAVTNGSVNLTEGVPFISECGTYTPQSCFFSQICNICSVLALWIVVIRFQQVRDYGNHGKANIVSIVLGFISSVGISVIGNFQQSVLMKIHLLGAFLAFFLGLAYFWVQLFLTYQAQPSQDRCWVGPARAMCCILCTILDPRSQTRIEPVSLSAGHRPTISPHTVALALGVSPLARDSTE
ncbi:transmembrane protein 150B, partial [Lates japonicus]